MARRHPSAFLLAAHLLSLLLYPLMDYTSSGRLIFSAVAVVVPLAVWVVNRSPFVSVVGWLLAVPALALTLIGVFLEHEALLPVSALFESALYFYAAASLIAYMLRDEHVSSDDLLRRRRHLHAAGVGIRLCVFRLPGVVPGQFRRGGRTRRSASAATSFHSGRVHACW